MMSAAPFLLQEDESESDCESEALSFADGTDEPSLAFSEVHNEAASNLRSIAEESSKMLSENPVVEASWRHKENFTTRSSYSSSNYSSRLVMEDSEIIGTSDHSQLTNGSASSLHRKQLEEDQAYAMSLLSSIQDNNDDMSSGSISISFDAHEQDGLINLEDMNGSSVAHDEHEDSLLIELEYSDVSSRESTTRRPKGEHLSDSASFEEDLGDPSATQSNATGQMDVTKDEPSEDSSRPSERHSLSRPAPPTKASSLKSFRDAYNGEGSLGNCSESSDTGGTDCQSLKEFRDIYQAEKEEEGALSQYSGGSGSTGKGSKQLQEHLAHLLSNTSDSSIPNVVQDGNDDVSLLSSSPKQWKPNGGSLALDTTEKSSAHEKGGLYSNVELSEAVPVEKSLVAKHQRKDTATSLKRFREAYNSDSSASSQYSVGQSATSESVTVGSSANSSSLKNFRDIYEAGKDEPSVFSQYSNETASTGKGSVQLQEHLTKLLSSSKSSRSSQQSELPTVVDENGDEAVSILSSNPSHSKDIPGKSLSGPPQREQTGAFSDSLVEEDVFTISSTLKAAKQRNESMKNSLNNALRVYEEMYGEAAAKEVFIKLTSEVLPASDRNGVEQTSGEETFDWKRSEQQPKISELSVVPLDGSRHRSGDQCEQDGLARSARSSSMESDEENEVTMVVAVTSLKTSPSTRRLHYMKYRASLNQKDADQSVGRSTSESTDSSGSIDVVLDTSKSVSGDSQRSSSSSVSLPVTTNSLPRNTTDQNTVDSSSKALVVNIQSSNTGEIDYQNSENNDEGPCSKPLYLRYRANLSAKTESIAEDEIEIQRSERRQSLSESEEARSVSFASEQSLEEFAPMEETTVNVTALSEFVPSSAEHSYNKYRSALSTPKETDDFGESESSASPSQCSSSTGSLIAGKRAAPTSTPSYNKYRSALSESTQVVDGTESSMSSSGGSGSMISFEVDDTKHVSNNNDDIPRSKAGYSQYRTTLSTPTLKQAPKDSESSCSSTHGSDSMVSLDNAGQVSSNDIAPISKCSYNKYRSVLSESKQVVDGSDSSMSSSGGSGSMTSFDVDDAKQVSNNNDDIPISKAGYMQYRTALSKPKQFPEGSEGSCSSTHGSDSMVSFKLDNTEQVGNNDMVPTSKGSYNKYRLALSESKQVVDDSGSSMSSSGGSGSMISFDVDDAKQVSNNNDISISKPGYTQLKQAPKDSGSSCGSSHGSGSMVSLELDNAGQVSSNDIAPISKCSYNKYRSALLESKQVDDGSEHSTSSSGGSGSMISFDVDDDKQVSNNNDDIPISKPGYTQSRSALLTPKQALNDSGSSCSSTHGSDSMVSLELDNVGQVSSNGIAPTTKCSYNKYRSALSESKQVDDGSEHSSSGGSGSMISFEVDDTKYVSNNNDGIPVSKPCYTHYRASLSMPKQATEGSERSLSRSHCSDSMVSLGSDDAKQADNNNDNSSKSEAISKLCYMQYRASLLPPNQAVEGCDSSLSSFCGSDTMVPLVPDGTKQADNNNNKGSPLSKPRYMKYRVTLSAKEQAANGSESSDEAQKSDGMAHGPGSAIPFGVSKSLFPSTAKPRYQQYRASMENNGGKDDNAVLRLNEANPPLVSIDNAAISAKTSTCAVSPDSQGASDSDSTSELHVIQHPTPVASKETLEDNGNPSSQDLGNSSVSRLIKKNCEEHKHAGNKMALLQKSGNLGVATSTAAVAPASRAKEDMDTTQEIKSRKKDLAGKSGCPEKQSDLDSPAKKRKSSMKKASARDTMKSSTRMSPRKNNLGALALDDVSACRNKADKFLDVRNDGGAEKSTLLKKHQETAVHSSLTRPTGQPTKTPMIESISSSLVPGEIAHVDATTDFVDIEPGNKAEENKPEQRKRRYCFLTLLLVVLLLGIGLGIAFGAFGLDSIRDNKDNEMPSTISAPSPDTPSDQASMQTPPMLAPTPLRVTQGPATPAPTPVVTSTMGRLLDLLIASGFGAAIINPKHW